MLATPEDFKPKAVFSPSGLTLARRCLNAWGRRYLLGLRKPELTWVEALAMPVPKAKVKSKPTAEERKAKKVYNSKFRPALGKECHARLESYYQGGNVDWYDRVGAIVLPGLEYLPHPDVCAKVEAEGEIEIVVDGVSFKGFRDLLVQIGAERWTSAGITFDVGEWLLVDHKTTFTFDYFDREKTLRTVKTPEQLRADPQANLYAYDVMRRLGLKTLRCRWLYYRTEDAPKALPVDFEIIWESASAIVAELVTEAKRLTEYVLAALDKPDAVRTLLEGLERNAFSCGDFGGCEHHSENEQGGDCTPPSISPGALLVQLRTKQKARAALPPKPKTERARKAGHMGFRNKPSTSAPAAEEQAADGQIEEVVEAEDIVEAESAGDDEKPSDEAPAPAPAPKAKPGRKPGGGFASAAAQDEDGVTVSTGGVTVDVPKASPLYKAIKKVCSARAAYEAALAGEL